ncbi:hypothetical protein OSTOST_05833 [Ostertagia ostertagi]
MEGDPVSTPICGLTYGSSHLNRSNAFPDLMIKTSKAGCENLRTWFAWSLHPLPDQLRINTLVGFLEGGARDIIDDLSDIDKNSYAKVVDHLRTHFESPQFRSLARQQLSDCKQGPTESAREFADRIKQIVKKVTRGQPKQAQNERLLDEFQDRLKPALRFHVKAANPLTFEEAVVKATTYESLLNDVASAITIFPGTQPTAPPPVRVVAARNTSAPLGPDQYRQRFPRQQRRKSRTYYPSNNRSRRFWERAPNADIICYRCGRKGHFQTFCHYSLPPAGLQPPQLPAPRNGNPPQNANFSRVSRNANQGDDVPHTVSSRSIYAGPGRRNEVLTADTSNDGIQSTDTVSEEDKDARIAALIERNNALADLVFATQNTTISDDPDGESVRRPTTSSKTPAWAYMCILSNNVSPIECRQKMMFEFAHNGSITRFYPMSGTYEVVDPSLITVIPHTDNPPLADIKPAITLFHNLVLTNISEFAPNIEFGELWSAVEGNQAALDAHLDTHPPDGKDGSSTTLVAAQLSLNPLPYLYKYLYQPWVAICCLLVTINVTIHILALYASFSSDSFLGRFLNNIPRPGAIRTDAIMMPDRIPVPSDPRQQAPFPYDFPRVFHISSRHSSLSAHIPLKINGISVSALIDTGSCITLAGQNLCPASGSSN